MRVIVSGPRDFQPDPKFFERIFTDALGECYYRNGKMFTRLLFGDCPTGIDYCVYRWVKSKGFKPNNYKQYKANWNKFGNAAGPRRNKMMRNDGKALIAFWGGRKIHQPDAPDGTLDMIKKALCAKLPVTLFDIDTEEMRFYYRVTTQEFMEAETILRTQPPSALNQFS